MKEGWLCPRCKRVNAPFTAYCDCKEATKNDVDCNHKWECCGMDTGGTTYRCSVCGEIRKEIYKQNGETLSLESTKEFCL